MSRGVVKFDGDLVRQNFNRLVYELNELYQFGRDVENTLNNKENRAFELV